MRDKYGNLIYVRAEGRSSIVDPHELCWFYLVELAVKCGSYKKADTIHYLLPGLNLNNGLRKVLGK